MFNRFFLFILFTCNLLLAETNSTVTLEDAMRVEALRQKIVAIDESIKDNLWYKRYGNYLTYQKLLEELSTVDAEVKKFKNSPFSKLAEPVELESYPKVTNPISIISALSYVKQIKQDSSDYKARIDRLGFLISKLEEKLKLFEEIQHLEPSITNEDHFYEAQKKLNAFIAAQEIANTSY